MAKLAGIYLHIPFCKQACHYCDFHFSTQTNGKSRMVANIAKEAIARASFIGDQPIETIYFGGGTPSLLSQTELKLLLDTLAEHYQLNHPEITLEANPDDLTAHKLSFWKHLGINRLSLGIQSFHDHALRFMNRCHTSQESQAAFDLARKAGFENISVDLIFGIQDLSPQEFEQDLAQILKLDAEHISTYCLTIEDGTAFGNWLKKGELKQVNQEHSSHQYQRVLEELTKQGYQQYEISNFAKPGLASKHNTAYWQGKKYLGLGPSAHSFDGAYTRSFNVSNNQHYNTAIESNRAAFETEELTPQIRFNETILTQLRMNQGLNLEELTFSHPHLVDDHFRRSIAELTLQKLILIENNFVKLTFNGKLMADSICERLFYVP